MSSVDSASRLPNTVRRSFSSSRPRLGVLRIASATSATAATRALLGHSPPAASAIAKGASQTSALRSSIPAGIAGHASAELPADRFTPRGEHVPQFIPFSSMHPTAIRLDVLTRSATAHTDNDCTAQDRIRQVAQASERHGTIGRQFLRLDCLPPHDAAAGHSAAPVARVEDARTSSFSFARGPNSVSISSNRIVGRPSGSETRRNRYAGDTFTAFDGTRDECFGYFQCSRFPASRLRRQECDPWRRLPGRHCMRVPDPQRMRDSRMFRRVGNESAEESMHVIE